MKLKKPTIVLAVVGFLGLREANLLTFEQFNDELKKIKAIEEE